MFNTLLVLYLLVTTLEIFQKAHTHESTPISTSNVYYPFKPRYKKQSTHLIKFSALLSSQIRASNWRLRNWLKKFTTDETHSHRANMIEYSNAYSDISMLPRLVPVLPMELYQYPSPPVPIIINSLGKISVSNQIIKETAPAPARKPGEKIPGIPGQPWIDYPLYSKVEQTTFSCTASGYGYFADPELGCQAWHYCHADGRKSSFLCPNGTLFHSEARVCGWWYNIPKCSIKSGLWPKSGISTYPVHATFQSQRLAPYEQNFTINDAIQSN